MNFKFNELRDEIETLELIDAGFCTSFLMNIKIVYFKMYSKPSEFMSHSHLKNSERYPVIHHKDRNRTNNSKDNLEVLCKSCHKKEHKTIMNIKHMRKKLTGRSQGGGRIHESAIRN